MKKKLFDTLKEKILNKKIILFGEIHGTHETPILFSEFLQEYAKVKDFEVCLELPLNEKELLNSLLMDSKDGRASLEMRRLIKDILALKKEIHFIDLNYDTELDKINIRDKIMAENVLNHLKEKQLIVLTGNIHTCKKEIKINNSFFETMGSILKKKLGSSVYTVNLMPLSGQVFNNTIKNIKFNDIKEFYDFTFTIEKVTPCNFKD